MTFWFRLWLVDRTRESMMAFSHEAIMAARQVLWDAKQAGNFDTFDVTVAMLDAAALAAVQGGTDG